MKLKALSLAMLLATPSFAFADGPSVMEIITFDAQPGATAEAVTAALGPIEAKMGQYGTLIARSVAEGPEGQWTMVNYWTDRDAMNRINEEALTWPEFGALRPWPHAVPQSFLGPLSGCHTGLRRGCDPWS